MKNKPLKPLFKQENKYSMAKSFPGFIIIAIIFFITSAIVGIVKVVTFPLIDMLCGNTDPGRASKALLVGFVFFITYDLLLDKGYEIYKKIKKQGK